MKGFAESQSVGEVALGILLGKVERSPHGGVAWSGGVEGGAQGYPMGEGTGETLGKGERCHKDAHGQGSAEETPERGWEEGRGVTGTPTLGACRRDPTSGQKAGESYQQKPPLGSGCSRGW